MRQAIDDNEGRPPTVCSRVAPTSMKWLGYALDVQNPVTILAGGIREAPCYTSGDLSYGDTLSCARVQPYRLQCSSCCRKIHDNWLTPFSVYHIVLTRIGKAKVAVIN